MPQSRARGRIGYFRLLINATGNNMGKGLTLPRLRAQRAMPSTCASTAEVPGHRGTVHWMISSLEQATLSNRCIFLVNSFKCVVNNHELRFIENVLPRQPITMGHRLSFL